VVLYLVFFSKNQNWWFFESENCEEPKPLVNSLNQNNHTTLVWSHSQWKKKLEV
jgi:hypothetical protein